MTEYIKQWIEKEIESSKSNNYPPDILIGMRLGLTKVIEIAEGFAVWAAKNHWFRSLHDGDTWVEMKEPERELHQNRCFTTSQLLEKYLSHLLNKEND